MEAQRSLLDHGSHHKPSLDSWDDGLRQHLQGLLDTHDMLEMFAASKIFERIRKPLIDRARLNLVMFRLTPPGRPHAGLSYRTFSKRCVLTDYLYKRGRWRLTDAEKQLTRNMTATLKSTCRMWAHRLTCGCSSWIWSQSMQRFLELQGTTSSSEEAAERLFRGPYSDSSSEEQADELRIHDSLLGQTWPAL